MTAIPARRRRRLIAAVTSSVLTVVALPGGLVLGANSLLNETGGNKVTSEATAVIPETPVELLVIKAVGDCKCPNSSRAIWRGQASFEL